MAKTPLRSLRIPDDLWEAAQEKAATEGRTVTAEIVAALKRYITRPPRSK